MAMEREIDRFRRALEASRRDLERIRDGIAAELGETEARIYDTHRMIVDDPS
jgi:phosphotransferase system enzyme I (PtsI)